jgi:hypothetical protein
MKYHKGRIHLKSMTMELVLMKVCMKYHKFSKMLMHTFKVELNLVHLLMMTTQLVMNSVHLLLITI